MIRTLFGSLMLAAVPVLALCCDGLRVEGAWIREPPPGTAVAAGYFQATNDTAQPVRVVGFSSPVFESSSLHETRYSQGRSEMRHLAGIELEAGGSFGAVPGGAHIMLSGSRVPVTGEAPVEISFQCESGSPLPVKFSVRRSAPD
jgi:copper(I)-binding protein